MKIWAVGLLGVAFLGACTSGGEGDEGDLPQATPSLPAAWDGALVVDPPSTTAGSIVSLTFPEENLRGIAFSLTPWRDNGGWGDPQFYVMATQNRRNADRSTWWRADDSEGRAWADIGVGGRGPDFLTLPDTADPGPYLLCTANAKDKLCALVTIET